MPSSTDSRGGGASSSSIAPPSMSSMLKPSLIKRWIRLAKRDDSSSEKPAVSIAVSNMSQMRSLMVLSDAFAEALSRRAMIIGWVGLSSMVFFDAIYEDMDESRRACAFMMRSMLAVHPYSPVTKQHGESFKREDTWTFSTLSERTSFMRVQRPWQAALASSKAFFSSSVSERVRPSLVAQMSFLPPNSFSCWTAYSSMGSTM